MYFVQRLNSHSREANSLLTLETQAVRSSYRDLPPKPVPPSAASRVDLQNKACAASVAPGPPHGPTQSFPTASPFTWVADVHPSLCHRLVSSAAPLLLSLFNATRRYMGVQQASQGAVGSSGLRR